MEAIINVLVGLVISILIIGIVLGVCYFTGHLFFKLVIYYQNSRYDETEYYTDQKIIVGICVLLIISMLLLLGYHIGDYFLSLLNIN